MKLRVALFSLVSLIAIGFSPSVQLRGQDIPDNLHKHDHGVIDSHQAQPTAGQQSDMAKMMAAMKATDQKLDDLMTKMNTAEGPAKIDAIAELLTTLVQDRRTMHDAMMSNMSKMMNMIPPMRGRGEAAPPAK
jgi:hypothetical protein